MGEVHRTRDWLAEVRKLPKAMVFVQHNPATPRYGRALAKLGYVLRESIGLGVRRSEGTTGSVEIASWSPNPDGLGYGYYSCFRLYLDGAQDQVVSAVLFCFYDGTEKSPGFRTLSSAQEYCRLHAFKDTL